MKVKYWKNFSKRKNSTKQPLAADATEVDIRLKDDNTIVNPAIEASSIPTDANYFYIDDFKRYYFLDNETKTTAMPLSVFSLESDVLASFKSEIAATNAMIVRASTNYNKMLRDDLIHVSTEKTITRTVGSDVGFADSDGCYLLTVANEDGGVNSFACQYILSAAGLSSIAQALMNSTITDDIMQYFANVNGAIIDLKWLPFNVTTVQNQCTTAGQPVKFGKYTAPGISAHRITSTSIYVDGHQTITIPWDSNEDFTECAPYTTMKLLIPMYGFVDLNSADFVSAKSVVLDYRYDITTGDVVMLISAGTSGAYLQTIQFNVSVDVPISTITREGGSIISSSAGMIGGSVGFLVSGATGNIAGMAASGMAAITSAASLGLNLNGASVSVKGSLQGRAGLAYSKKPQLMLYMMHHADPTRSEHIAAVGRPVQACASIGSFSGYIQCSDASVSMAGTALEKDRVNQYLNTGFFYE